MAWHEELLLACSELRVVERVDQDLIIQDVALRLLHNPTYDQYPVSHSVTQIDKCWLYGMRTQGSQLEQKLHIHMGSGIITCCFASSGEALSYC